MHTDPYGQGWLAVLQPADWAADCRAPVQGDAVLPAMRLDAALSLHD